MSGLEPSIALCASLPLPIGGDGNTAPEWVHLLPAGEITTQDGRGPYRVSDAETLIATSMTDGARLPLDENHATDLAAPQGHPAPARGWIVAMQARPDGIWGRVEWTNDGRDLITARAYRHISPVIFHRPDGGIVSVLRASLVNRPNLKGLASLHAENSPLADRLKMFLGITTEATDGMIFERVAGEHQKAAEAAASQGQFLAELRKLLFLQPDANISAILARLRSDAAERAQLGEAVGLQAAADGAAVLQAVQTLRDPAKFVPAATALALHAELSSLHQSVARDRAESVVDDAIRAGKIPAPGTMRPHYIARHMAEPAQVEKELAMMVSLSGRSVAGARPPEFGAGTAGSLDADETKVIALMGVDAEAFRATRDKLAAQETDR